MPADRYPAVFYGRDDGPVCFETYLYATEADTREFVSSLSDSPYHWLWASWVRWVEEGVDDKDERPLTWLGPETHEDFLGDLLWRDSDGTGLQMAVLGYSERPVDLMSSEVDVFTALKEQFRRFIADSRDAPHVVLIVDGAGPDLLFVQPNPPAEVLTLLETWGLGPDCEKKRLPYSSLRVARLEMAFGGVDSPTKPTDFRRRRPRAGGGGSSRSGR